MASGTQRDWQEATVVEARTVADEVRRITLERPPSRRALPGTHVDVRVDLGGRSDVRSYSVVESDDDGSHLTLSVLLTRRSRGGSRFMHGLTEGDRLPMTQPLQNFPLRVGAPRYVVLAGGIGVTATVQTASTLRRLDHDYEVVYVGRTRSSMAYVDDLAAEHGERLAVHVDDEGTGLDVDALVRAVADHEHAASTELYMCGPIRLMDAVRRAWAEAALPVWNLRFETFGNSGWCDPEDFVVRVPDQGLETTVGADTTILEALDAAGADVMFDCRKGECGLCQVAVVDVDGRIDHRDVFLSERQQGAGTVLCSCVSRIASDGSAPPAVTLRLP